MKLKIVLAFAALSIAAPTITMEDQSWLNSLKYKFWSAMHPFVNATKRAFAENKYIRGRFQEKILNDIVQINEIKTALTERHQLYKEIREIIQSGSTVKEAETRKLRADHQKIHQDLKKCAGVSEEDWNEFEKKFEIAKSIDPVFASHNSESQEDEEHTDAITQLIRSKLKRNKIDSKKVGIEFRNDYNNAALSSRKGNYKKNNMRPPNHVIVMGINYIENPLTSIDFTVEHEIQHLKQHHNAENSLLQEIIPFLDVPDEWFTPLRRHQEIEADSLAALEDIAIARAGVYDYCRRQSQNNYYASYPSHPSLYKRCTQITRIARMLEIEKSLKEKQKTA